MNQQQALRFSDPVTEGMRRKREGISRAEASSKGVVQRVREAMVRLAEAKGSADADDARDFCARAGIRLTKFQWGSVWRSGRDFQWVAIGEKPSRHPGNHGHRNKIWMLIRK